MCCEWHHAQSSLYLVLTAESPGLYIGCCCHTMEPRQAHWRLPRRPTLPLGLAPSLSCSTCRRQARHGQPSQELLLRRVISTNRSTAGGYGRESSSTACAGSAMRET